MTGLAVVMVLSSAVLHATWNLFAKRVSGGVGFIWLLTALQSLIFLPLALYVLVAEQPPLSPMHLVFVVGSGMLHIGYFTLLSKGYQQGDLSLVYPLARGTGPMLSTTAAILFLGERPSGLALAGAACIGIGVFILTGDPRKFRANGAWRGVVYALLTGVVIAAYTLWDKQAVTLLIFPPLLYDWACSTARGIILMPYALGHRDEIARHWKLHRREALGVAVLSPLSYILVLTALTFSPVSYVAPAREISILIGALFGARLLAEGDVRRRLWAAGVMVAGVAALALG